MTQFSIGGLVLGKNPVIKNIQYGEISNDSTSATATGTIDAVDTANSVVMWLGNRMGNDSATPDRYFNRLTLTNATTVTATRGSTQQEEHFISFVVIEFHAGVLKLNQVGTLVCDDASITDTITGVNTTKAWLVEQGQMGDFVDDELFSTMTLTDSTTVTMNRKDTTGIVTRSYAVIEFF